MDYLFLYALYNAEIQTLSHYQFVFSFFFFFFFYRTPYKVVAQNGQGEGEIFQKLHIAVIIVIELRWNFILKVVRHIC